MNVPNSVLTIIIIAVVATLLIIAMWRFTKFSVRGKYLGVEGELTGERTHSDRASSTKTATERKHIVTTKIGGSVDDSTVISAGGDISRRRTSTNPTSDEQQFGDVRTEIGQDVTGSDVESAGGNVDAKA